jgi:hypothetical protein
MTETDEAAMIKEVTTILTKNEGQQPKGWLSPWLAPSERTADLLAVRLTQTVLSFKPIAGKKKK